MASAEDVYSTATANREEATRAKEIALQKLQQKDWQAAKRLFLKAQRLCPDLEGVANCIVAAEVHIVSEATVHTTPYREITRDYYAILDVKQDVSKKDLVQQYKKRAFQLHPDKNQYPGAEAAFKLLGEAFAVLKDDDKRRKHDIQRHHRLNFQNGSRPTGGQSQPHPRQPGAPPQNRAPYAQPFGGGTWLPNWFSGGTAGTGFPQAARPPPQRPPAGVPRYSSGSTFAGYSVNEQGGRVPVATNQPGGATGSTQQRPAQWAGMRPGSQPGTFAPQPAGVSFQPGRASGQAGSQPGASASQRGNLGAQPGISVNQPGMVNARAGVPLTRPGVSVPQPGAPIHNPGAFVNQPGAPTGHPRTSPSAPTATGPTGRPTGQTGAFSAQPTAGQIHPGAYPGASSGQQFPAGGIPWPVQTAPPGRYLSTCFSCLQKYTFPLHAINAWVRCQRCKAAFRATEDGVVTRVAARAAPAPPLPPRTPPATADGSTSPFAAPAGGFAAPAGGGSGPSGVPSAMPSESNTAPINRVKQAWDEAVKIRTDHQKEKKREARQLKKAEKKERELELERLRAVREEARQARAEEKARRQQMRDKADAESRAKVTAEDEHIPLRSTSKPVNVDSVNFENASGLPDAAGSDMDDEPLIRRKKGRLQKVGEILGVSLSEGVKGAGLGKKADETGVMASGVRVNGVGKGEELQDSENEPILGKRNGSEVGVVEGGPEGRLKENEGSLRVGLAAGTANGTEDRRKRRRVSYIELSDREEGSEEEDGLKRRAEKGKAKMGEGSTAAIEGDPPTGGKNGSGIEKWLRVENEETEVSVTCEEMKSRTGPGERSTARMERDPPAGQSTVEIQDDPLGEVLPGRTGKKYVSMLKILSVRNTFRPGDSESRIGRPLLIPAGSLRLHGPSLNALPSTEIEHFDDKRAASVKEPSSEEKAGPSEGGEKCPVESTGGNAGPSQAGEKRPVGLTGGIAGPSQAGEKRPVGPTAESIGPTDAGEKRSRGPTGGNAGPSEAGEKGSGGPTGGKSGPSGGISHQGADEAGPSDENGHPLDEDDGSVPDTMFFDFDKARKETDVRLGEFWALYDDQDEMPRFYSRVDTVSLNPFQGTLTWFEAADQTRENFTARLPGLAVRGVSPGVGKFIYGTSTDFDSINTFAYRQTAVEETPGGGVKLAPRCGEVWAMFRPEKGTKWKKDEKWIGYNLVVIARADGGFAVTRLVQIPGHRSLFQPVKDAVGEPQRVAVKTSDLPLFSHRILAKRVPPHLIEQSDPTQKVEIWELDPAALPSEEDA